ncbi:uncharacterized protein LOC119532546 [Choloepus didactylus]|uniref:uncharacterized protein LOC119532546 n=1 Tax=Choloepus didactylus TaxID=27675 RepID=UPI0018A05239|nr:uncharacterized protein LOC119532546 [Choloepus didactylus]
MAGLRHSRSTCIRAAFSSVRAGFQKSSGKRLHRFKVNPRRIRTDLAEGIWREFLDPYDGELEDTAAHSDCSFNHRSLGSRRRNMASCAPTSKGPGGVNLEDCPSSQCPDFLVKAAGSAPAGQEAVDVDMVPVSEPRPVAQASGSEVGGWAPRRPPWPEDPRMTEEERGPRAAGPFLAPTETPDAGRHGWSRTQALRPPRGLGSEREQGPKLSLLKRKLELLLTEPEKNKRKKQYVA